MHGNGKTMGLLIATSALAVELYADVLKIYYENNQYGIFACFIASVFKL